MPYTVITDQTETAKELAILQAALDLINTKGWEMSGCLDLDVRILDAILADPQTYLAVKTAREAELS